MENTLENKEKFFAQYWGLQIIRKKHDTTYYFINNNNMKFSEYWDIFDKWLELTPLELISDEDAIEVAKIFDIQLPIDEVDKSSNAIQVFDELGNKVCIYFDGEIIIEEGAIQQPLALLKSYDFLRSKSYALPFREYSVSQMIDFGWIKLKNK